MMIKNENIQNEQGLVHQSSIKFVRGKHQPLLLELPEKPDSALNVSASAASTRRSSAMFESDVCHLSSAGSDKQFGPSALADYCDSSQMVLSADGESRSQNLLSKKAATNEVLDRAFFTQLRKEREQRQKRDEEQEVVKRNSLIFDYDVSIRGRVCHKKASKSIDRMGDAIKSNQDTIDLFRNWQSNFNNLCDKKLTKIQAQQRTARNAAVAKVQPAASAASPRALPRITKEQQITIKPKQIRPCELRRQAAASQPRRQSIIRGIPYRFNLPGIAKPTAN